MDAIKLQGFINIELINKKNNIRRVYKNTITNAGKQLFLAKSAGVLLDGNDNLFGKTIVSSAMTQINSSVYNNTTAIIFRQSNSNKEITNVLLNLGSEANSLTADSTFINPWDTNLAEASKLVGYANSNINPLDNGKEGSLDYTKGEYMADPSVVCNRWKYPEGVASGTIDTIAMMPANVVLTNQGDGVNIGKLLDKVNIKYTNYESMSTSFLFPGVPGYTSNDEILLDFTRDGCSKWKYNIATGEIAQVPDTDNFWVLPVETTSAPYHIMDSIVIGNYLYVVGIENMESYYIYVTVYDIANNMNKITTYQCKQNTTKDKYTNAKFLKIGDSLYVTVWASGTIGSTVVNAKIWKLTNNGTYFNAASTGTTDFSSIGFNTPTGVNIAQIGLGNYGDKYIMFIGCNYYRENGAVLSSVNAGYKSMGYVFTDLSNPLGTLVDVISGINPKSILFSAGSNKGMLRVGADKYNTGAQSGNYYDKVDYYKSTINNDNSSLSSYYDCLTSGVIYNPDKSWTNVISFVKLSEPIMKTDDDIMYVSYGYKVV